MELCQKLSYLRMEATLSQFTVAETLHVSRQAISHWETGDVVPTLENLIHLSQLYGVSLDELLNNRAEPPFQPPITRPLPQKPAEPEKVEPEAVEPAPEPPEPEAVVPPEAAAAEPVLAADKQTALKPMLKQMTPVLLIFLVFLMLLSMACGFLLSTWVYSKTTASSFETVEVFDMNKMKGEEVTVSEHFSIGPIEP